MNDLDTIEARSAARVADQIATATRRRTARDGFHRAHVYRRRFGNAARHTQKLARSAIAAGTIPAASPAASQEKP